MRSICVIAFILVLTGCAEIVPEPFEPSSGHINTEDSVTSESIPPLVQQVPVLPEPEPVVELEKYTVVVNEVPVKELLFALARDAQVNVDIDPRIEGVVTVNAIDQTLPQLLDRIARQVTLRYQFIDNNLIISPDEPFFRTYRVNYLNMARETTGNITASSQIGEGGGSGGSGGGGGGGGSGGSNSTTDVTSETANFFWANLVQGVSALIGEEAASGSGQGGQIAITANVIPHPESGLLTVNATHRQHELIQYFIDNALESAHRQVLIQATILEVTLNDQYQSGIDWSFINQAGKSGFDFVSSTFTGVPIGTLSSFLLEYNDPNPNREEIVSASLRLLEEFGKVSVLSSPQIMALNNQTAILKVVDNIVYFDVEVETTIQDAVALTTFDTNANTVPVGIIMSLTPQINENDSIILQVRPTISRVLDFVNDPNPELAREGVSNPVPQIQVREMESVLRMNNGQVAVLGGLMQEDARGNDAAIPGLSKPPGLGELFKSRQRDYQKRELVIFLRPSLIKTPSLDEDLRRYKTFLEQNTRKQETKREGGES